MSTVTMGWEPSGLTRLVDQSRAETKAAKEPGRVMRLVRKVFAAVALAFAVMSFSGGTAQAWPWDDAIGDIASYVSNICGPNDIGPYVNTSQGGFDGLFNSMDKGGLQLYGQKSGVLGETATHVPPAGNYQKSPSGSAQTRLNTYYKDAPPSVKNPTFQRYGMGTFRWTAFGGGCFSPNYITGPLVNGMFLIFVVLPVTVTIVMINFALQVDLSALASLMAQPVYAMFTAIAAPWWVLLATIGGVWTWVRTRGSLAALVKYVIFAFVCVGTMGWIGSNTTDVVFKANQVVTKAVGAAACAFQGNPVGSTACKEPAAGISNSIWKGLAYQPWAAGQVGTAAAGSEYGSSNMPWSAAFLNGMYYSPDDAEGRKLLGDVQAWDGWSYSGGDDDDDSKMKNGRKYRQYEKIPFLATVQIMCHDDTTKNDAKDQQWLYQGQCDRRSDTDSTADIVKNVRNSTYDTRMLIAVTAAFGSYIVGGALIWIGAYVTMQRFLFVYLLAFAPLWLTIALIGDNKRKAFAKKYFEMLFANLMKQVLAVCILLMVAHSLSLIMVPPKEAGPLVASIPWIFKPWMMIMFMWALTLLFIPFLRLAKAVAKGDTSVVTKMGNAPQSAAKTVGKAAVIGGAALATGGVSLGAAASTLGKTVASAKSAGGARAALQAVGGGSAGRGLTAAGRLVGGEKGRMLSKIGRGSSMLERGMVSSQARELGVQQTAKANGLLGPDGKLSPQNRTKAENIYAANNQKLADDQKLASTPEGRQVLAERERDARVRSMAAGDKEKYEHNASGELTPRGLAKASEDFAKVEEQQKRKPEFDAFYARHGKFHSDDLRGIRAKEAREMSIQRMAAGDPAKYAHDETGSLTEAGYKQAAQDFDQAQMQKERMPEFEAYRQRYGQYHPEDARALKAGIDREAGIQKWGAANPSKYAHEAGELTEEGRAAAEKDYDEAQRKAGLMTANRGLYDAYMAANGGERHPDDFRGAARPGGLSAPVPEYDADQRAGAQEEAWTRVGQSPLTRSPDLAVQGRVTGSDALAASGLTMQEAVDNPSVLVTPVTDDSSMMAPYNNGSTAHMDPSHPATEPLTRLKFAEQSGTNTEVAQARAAAQSAIQEHGIPDEVSAVRSEGPTAAQFDPQQMFAASPVLSPDMPWQDRADAAVAMQAAATALPAEFGPGASAAVDAYVGALGSPEVGTGEVENLRRMAYDAVMEGMSQAADNADEAFSGASVGAGVGGVNVVAGSGDSGQGSFSVFDQESAFQDSWRDAPLPSDPGHGFEAPPDYQTYGEERSGGSVGGFDGGFDGGSGGDAYEAPLPGPAPERQGGSYAQDDSSYFGGVNDAPLPGPGPEPRDQGGFSDERPSGAGAYEAPLPGPAPEPRDQGGSSFGGGSDAPLPGPGPDAPLPGPVPDQSQYRGPSGHAPNGAGYDGPVDQGPGYTGHQGPSVPEQHNGAREVPPAGDIGYQGPGPAQSPQGGQGGGFGGLFAGGDRPAQSRRERREANPAPNDEPLPDEAMRGEGDEVGNLRDRSPEDGESDLFGDDN